jgi:hypothetical protein
VKIFLAYLLTILFILFNNVEARIEHYNVGQEVTEYLDLSKKTRVKLPEGKWEVIDRWTESGHGLKFSVLGLGRIENNEIVEMMEVAYSNLAGAYIKYIDHAMIEVIFKGNHDGCYERPEYYLVEVFRKGSTHNCLVIDHIDVMKELNNPDDPYDKGIMSPIKYWLKNNSDVKVPFIMLGSFHSYFSRLVGGYWVGLSYAINPKLLNAPANNFFTEDTSEYHKLNIHRYPEHKKTMEKWVSISSQRHKEFENLGKAKTGHKLKLDRYIIGENTIIKSNNKDIANQLKSLNDLYKSGALSKEEFKKAKKKLLN